MEVGDIGVTGGILWEVLHVGESAPQCDQLHPADDWDDAPRYCVTEDGARRPRIYGTASPSDG